jgi:RPA family protein
MSAPGNREVAHRLFAAEYDDATLQYAESDEERAPNYVVTPTGARVNRLFVVGVLTEIEQVGEEVLRARVADPTGAFVIYAGQYQPDALAFLEDAEPPAFVAVTGKARTFQPEDADRIYTSVRPESINAVDADTRDRWTVTAAEQTLARIDTMALALQSDLRGDALAGALEAAGLAPGHAEGIALAIDHYDTSADYLAALADRTLDALRVVSGDRDEVPALDIAPDAETDGRLPLELPTNRALVEGPLAAPADESAAADVAETATDAPEESATATDTAESATTASETDPTASETETTAAADDEPADTAADEGPTDAADEAAGEAATAEADATDTADADTGSADTGSADTDAPDAGDAGADAPDDGAADPSDAEPADADEPPAETAADPDETPTDADSTDETVAVDDVEDVEEFELDAEERERLEDEFGTEFSTGTDVSEPGEADIEVPEPEDSTEEAAAAEPADTAAEATDTATDSQEATASDTGADETAASDGASTTDETASADEDIDLETAVLEHMESLDDGDGADRDALVAAVVEATGADEEAVVDAIDDALMDGRCYEPGDGMLKPI